MAFGPFLVLTPTRKITLKKETFFKKLVVGAQKDETRYFALAMFVVLTGMQVFVVYSIYVVLEAITNDLRLILGIVVGYSLVCLFYLVIFYSVMMKKEVVIGGINLMDQIRKNIKIKTKGKNDDPNEFQEYDEEGNPVKKVNVLNHKHYIKAYLAAFVVILLGCIGMIIFMFVEQSAVWDQLSTLGQTIITGFFVLNLLTVVTLTIFVLNIAFHPVNVAIEVVMDDGTVVSVDKIRYCAVARCADRVPLFAYGQQYDPNKEAIMRLVMDEIEGCENKAFHHASKSLGTFGTLHQSNDWKCIFMLLTGEGYNADLADHFMFKFQTYIQTTCYDDLSYGGSGQGNGEEVNSGNSHGRQDGFLKLSPLQWLSPCYGYIDALAKDYSDEKKIKHLKDDAVKFKELLEKWTSVAGVRTSQLIEFFQDGRWKAANNDLALIYDNGIRRIVGEKASSETLQRRQKIEMEQRSTLSSAGLFFGGMEIDESALIDRSMKLESLETKSMMLENQSMAFKKRSGKKNRSFGKPKSSAMPKPQAKPESLPSKQPKVEPKAEKKQKSKKPAKERKREKMPPRDEDIPEKRKQKKKKMDRKKIDRSMEKKEKDLSLGGEIMDDTTVELFVEVDTALDAQETEHRMLQKYWGVVEADIGPRPSLGVNAKPSEVNMEIYSAVSRSSMFKRPTKFVSPVGGAKVTNGGLTVEKDQDSGVAFGMSVGNWPALLNVFSFEVTVECVDGGAKDSTIAIGFQPNLYLLKNMTVSSPMYCCVSNGHRVGTLGAFQQTQFSESTVYGCGFKPSESSESTSSSSQFLSESADEEADDFYTAIVKAKEAEQAAKGKGKGKGKEDEKSSKHSETVMRVNTSQQTVVTAMVDYGLGVVSFAINGVYQGVAFQIADKEVGLYPIIAGWGKWKATANFGDQPFKFPHAMSVGRNNPFFNKPFNVTKPETAMDPLALEDMFLEYGKAQSEFESAVEGATAKYFDLVNEDKVNTYDLDKCCCNILRVFRSSMSTVGNDHVVTGMFKGWRAMPGREQRYIRDVIVNHQAMIGQLVISDGIAGCYPEEFKAQWIRDLRMCVSMDDLALDIISEEFQFYGRSTTMIACLVHVWFDAMLWSVQPSFVAACNHLRAIREGLEEFDVQTPLKDLHRQTGTLETVEKAKKDVIVSLKKEIEKWLEEMIELLSV
eukprot:TRINITY_DN318_c0_g1_i5.p1 TRINITY_DN318_c0_g1~~TRINITY_DN318_c0_g1_i5.p1  ORF type:complete len:1175 (-),score=431.78 TRINITY_DN318_c0_g1_i5:725-4249(-)